jgi:hypothetical protein
MKPQVLTWDDGTQWDAWPARHFDERAGVWLPIAKNGAGKVTVTPNEAGRWRCAVAGSTLCAGPMTTRTSCRCNRRGGGRCFGPRTNSVRGVHKNEHLLYAFIEARRDGGIREE